MAYDPVCWICGGDADSGEHSAKRTDLLSWVGKATQAQPLTYRRGFDAKFLNSVDDNSVKWRHKICRKCNNSLTQPYDDAWAMASKFLRDLPKPLGCRINIDGCRIFGKNHKIKMDHMNLYFVKYIGCAINDANENNSLIIRSGVRKKGEILKILSEYIKFGKSCPYLYLSVWNEPGRNSTSIEVGDVKYVYDDFSDKPAYFATKYCVSNYVVDILLSFYEGRPPEFAGFWNPQDGSQIRIQNHSPRQQLASLPRRDGR